MKLKLFTISTLVFLFAFLFPSTLFAKEQINSFMSQITVNQDTSLTIVEVIQYQTDQSKHGIYRYIPERLNNGRLSQVTPVRILSVADGNQNLLPFEKFKENGNVVLKIGDPDQTFTGEKTYVISYVVDRALSKKNSDQDLVWDITGEGWQLPILNTSAVIFSPSAKIKEMDCFSGDVGGNDNLCQGELLSDGSVAKLNYGQGISYGKNVTVFLNFDPDNDFSWPSSLKIIVYKFIDNFFIFLLPLPMLLMFGIWWKWGRDYISNAGNIYNVNLDQPSRKKSLFFSYRSPLVFQPPEMMSAGQAGVLIDENVDNADVIAEILELARKKYLKITQTKKKQLLGSKVDYVFEKIKPGDKSLSEVQKFLHQKLFESEEKIAVSKLKGKFYTHFNKAKNKLAASVTRDNWFSHNPTTMRVAGIVIWALGFGFAMMVAIFASEWVGSIWPIGFVILTAVPGFLLGYHLPQKTVVGSNLFLQVKGLKEMIKRGAWREKIKEKHLFIEEILPFAVSLGVVEKLAADMKDLGLKPPEYLGGSSVRGLATYALVNDMSKSISSGLSYNPSSSHSSGGGFSGGGGGGGGGGSW